MSKDHNAAETFISVAHVASELFKAQSIAEELSITSKNARALAVRAGSTAATSVNTIAISQTKIAANLFRTGGFLERLNRVDYQPKQGSIDHIKEIFDRVENEKKKLEREISVSLRGLMDRLDETKMELRATQVVSVVSRVEASRASEDFQDSLNSVADKVSSAGSRINSHLETARKHLSHLQ